MSYIKRVNQIVYPEVLAILEPFRDQPLTEWLVAYGEKIGEPIKPWRARAITSYLTGGATWCRNKRTLVRWLVKWGLTPQAADGVLLQHRQTRPRATDE